jgi:hypothetical protein
MFTNSDFTAAKAIKCHNGWPQFMFYDSRNQRSEMQYKILFSCVDNVKYHPWAQIWKYA